MFIHVKSDSLLAKLHPDLSAIERLIGFHINEVDYQRFRDEADRVVGHLSAEEKHVWAVYNAHKHPGFLPHSRMESMEATLAAKIASLAKQTKRPKWLTPAFIVQAVIAILLILLLFGVKLHAAPPDPRLLSLLRRPPLMLPQGPAARNGIGGLQVQIQAAGTPLGTFSSFLILNFGTGTSVIRSGSVFTITSTGGGGGTGCIPPGTVANALLYDSGAGACTDITKWTSNGTTTLTALSTAIFDLTNAAQFRLPTGAAPTTDALESFDLTTHRPVWGFNGASTISIPLTKAAVGSKWLTSYDQATGGFGQTQPNITDVINGCNTTGGVTGQVFESNGSGCGSYQDPIISPNQDAIQTAAWTSATAGNTALNIATSNRSTITVSFNGSSITGGVVTFEHSPDNATWYLAVGLRGDGTAADTAYTLTGANQSWTFPIAGYTNFRIRLSTVITGAGTANIGAITQAEGSPSINLVLAQQSGTWTVQQGGAPWSVVGTLTNNNAAPGTNGIMSLICRANASAPTWTEGDLVLCSEDLSGNLRITGSITANAGTNLNTSLLQLDATGVKLNLAQGSATSGQTGPLIQCAVTTATPSYTTTNTFPVSCTPAGAVRVDGSAVTQPVSIAATVTVAGGKTNDNAAPGATNDGVLPCLANAATPSWTEGDQVVCSVDLSGQQRVRGTLSDNGAAAAANRLAILGGTYEATYNGGTAGTAGRDAAMSVGTDGLLDVAALPAIRPASFHWSASFAGSSTTIAAHIAGNATNILLLTKISFSCTQTTAGNVSLTVNKTSAASTGGTAATITAVPDDSTYSAAVSVAQSFTGTGPTVGTLVGQIDSYKLGCMAVSTATPNDIYVLNLRQKPIVLRGTAQTVEIGVGAATTGGNYTVTFEGMEITTITP